MIDQDGVNLTSYRGLSVNPTTYELEMTTEIGAGSYELFFIACNNADQCNDPSSTIALVKLEVVQVVEAIPQSPP